jgi:hypothetical protein
LFEFIRGKPFLSTIIGGTITKIKTKINPPGQEMAERPAAAIPGPGRARQRRSRYFFIFMLYFPFAKEGA